MVVLLHVEWWFRQLCCSSIKTCNTTSVSYNHYTDIYSQTYIFITYAGNAAEEEFKGDYDKTNADDDAAFADEGVQHAQQEEENMYVLK